MPAYNLKKLFNVNELLSNRLRIFIRLVVSLSGEYDIKIFRHNYDMAIKILCNQS